MRRPLTAAQHDARDARRERFKALATQLAALSDAERTHLIETVPFLATVEGRALSIGNMCLVACQCPTATLVGGFQQWRQHGRQVRKGEHGLMVWAPTRRANGEGPTPADLDSDRPRFIMVTVFDVMQTEVAS